VNSSVLCILLLAWAGCGGGGNNESATLFSLGGTVSGLAGSGLILQNNGANNSPVTANGAFALTSPIAKNSSYDVTVLTQPSNPVQVCTVTNGSGIATANVTNITVVCTTTAYTIGGTVSGLVGAGLVLQDNGGNNLTIIANGSFVFTNPVDLGATFAVTVLTQPSNPTQTCTVSNGSGTATANVTNVQVACSSTISGTVAGLSGKGLVLQDNSGDNLPVSQNGPFTFPTQIAYGGSYAVTVFAQPATPAQACLVIDGSGTAFADVTNVQVNCNNNWTWVGGPNTSNQAGVYGTMGVASPSNNPGARTAAVSWTDAAGNFWLYGGSGYDSTGANNDLGDLWEYSAGEWTWVGGSNVVSQPATYGTQGVAAPGNYPGARDGSAAWTDKSGNFWLFGGIGRFTGNGCGPGPVACSGQFNDLWEYSGGEWTWIGGPNTPFGTGTYGTQGVASAANVPPSRESATAWVDQAGDFWLYGGNSGLGPPNGVYGDLWKYSAGEWTWVSGSDVISPSAVYGTLGVPAPENTPGSRINPVVWLDSSQNIWLFGGVGYNTVGSQSDLWRYSGGEWTWMGGPEINEQPGIYGTLGVPAASNIPGARGWGSGVSWVDAKGNFWMFGGFGEGAIEDFDQSLGDVWNYNGSEWTWIGGSNATFQPAVYEAMGMPGDPGGRDSAATWIDNSGNIWLFGGEDQGTTGHPGYLLSDLWKYTPPTAGDQRNARRTQKGTR